MPIDIRPERPEDTAAIRALTAAAFAGAPHSSGTEAAIVDALREAGALAVSLVALEAGEPVGHAAFSPVVIDGPLVAVDGASSAIDEAAGGWFGLGPLSVRPDRQRRGIGAALVRAGLDTLRERGAGGCVVLGEPAYYRRFGFEADSDLRLDGVPPEYFMALTLAGPKPAGTVRYHSGFSAG